MQMTCHATVPHPQWVSSWLLPHRHERRTREFSLFQRCNRGLSYSHFLRTRPSFERACLPAYPHAGARFRWPAAAMRQPQSGAPFAKALSPTCALAFALGAAALLPALESKLGDP